MRPAMTPPATQALTVRLPEDLYDKLRKTAFDQHTSMNALIIAAVRHQQDMSCQAGSSHVVPCPAVP